MVKFTDNQYTILMVTIIVATDFSEVAENAVEYAAAAAKHGNARLVLFNSYVLPVHAANTILPASSIQKLMDENENRLQERALDLSKTYGIKVGFEARFSFVEDELSDLIDRHKADLLVLGMKARTLEQDLMGNTTTAAIKKLKFPVLAVPIGAKFGEIKKILFACDVLRGVPKKILKRIKELATSLNAEVEVFHVNNAIEEMKTDHPALSSKDGIGSGLSGVSYYYKNVKSNEVIKEIEKEIKEFKADLLIMIPNKYGFWASLVHRSKTRVMASGLDIPLFSIPI